MESKFTVGLDFNGTLTYFTGYDSSSGQISMTDNTHEMRFGEKEECYKLVEQLRELTGQLFLVVEIEIEGD